MEGRAASPTFRVWDDFLCEVLLPLKLFLSASRNGDWKVHQAAKAKLLPLLFASNRTTYARYMPYQYLQLRRLPSEVADAFNDGNFVAKLTEGNFNAFWIDYTIEAT